MTTMLIGAGAWGTALAIAAQRKGQALLWTEEEAQAEELRATRENARFLPDVPLPPALDIGGGSAGLLDAARGASLIVIAAPVAALRTLLTQLAAGGIKAPVAWACKGFEAVPDDAPAGAFGLMPHEVQQQIAPALLGGALSGPSFALEVARGRPTAIVAASPHAAVREALQAAFHGGNLRIYANDDICGVETGAAVKNVLAIACGLVDGLQLGLNTRAALLTRGLAEMARLGVALGARRDTFMGLSGMGDLVLTATGDLSRNRRIGLLLAEGKPLDEALGSLGHVAEGVYSARTVWQRAQHLGVDMPITENVVALLDGRTTAQQVVADLMGREARAEA